MYNTTITSKNIAILVLKSEFHQPTTIFLTSCSRSPFLQDKNEFNPEQWVVQKVSIFLLPSNRLQTWYNLERLAGTGFSGSSAWAQPVDSLSESTGNSQPGPPMPGARCGTGFEGSNACAIQREGSGFDPTSPLPKMGLAPIAQSLGQTVAVATWLQPCRALFLGLAALALSLCKRVTILD